MNVGETSKIYDKLIEGWELPLALLGGTRCMRQNPNRWLPAYSKESAKDHAARVSGTALYNSFRRTVRVLSSKPFKDPVKIVKTAPALEVLEYDVDRQKSNITRFARSQLADMLTFGLAHFLVDNPVFSGTLTRADEKALNIHPYFCRVRPDTLIYWRHVEGLTGELILDEIRIRSELVDPTDNEDYWIITQWTRDSITRYKQKKNADKKDEWTKVDDLPNMLGYVPLVTTYADASKEGVFQAACPLEDLADLNLRHYRSQSDQDACLHFARVPFLHFAGFEESEVNKTIAVSNAYVSKRHEAKITWVETTGAALEQGSRDLEQIEARMDVMGADLMVQKPGNPTATAKSIDTAEKISDLQAMVMALEGSLEYGYEIAGEWIREDGSQTDIQLDVNFGLTLNDAKEIDFLLKTRIAGEISRELFYQEIQRRGIFEEFDIEKELNAAALEDKRKEDLPALGENDE